MATAKNVKKTPTSLKPSVGFTGFSGPVSAIKHAEIDMTQIMYDKRFGSVYSEEIIGNTFNAEYVARIMSNPQTKHAMVEHLLGETLGEAFVAAIGKGKHKVGEEVLSRGRLARAVSERATDLSGEAQLALTEMLIKLIAPLNLMQPIDAQGDRVVSVTRHYKFLPTFQEVMTDVLTRELKTRLDELPPLDVGSNLRFTAEIMADRINAHAKQAARALRRVNEIRVLIIDVLKIVRVKCDPKAMGIEGGIPLALIDRAEVDDFAKIFNIVKFAMDSSIVEDLKLSTDYTRLIAEMPMVFATLRNSDRYGLMSTSEFKDRFTKTTVRDIDMRPQLSILSHNVVGANVAQAVIMGAPITGAGNGKHVMTAPATEAYLSGMYGDLLKEVASDKVHDVVAGVYEHLVLHNEFKDRGIYGLNTLYFSDDEESVYQLLAIATAQRVVLAYHVDSKQPLLMYRVDVANVPYDPVSTTRIMDEILVTDAREAVHLATDWRGTKFLADRNQVLPLQAVNATVLDDGFEDYAAINKRVVFSQNVAGSEMRVWFDLATRGALIDEEVALVVPPLVNRYVLATATAVLTDALDIANTVADPAIRIGIKQRVFALVLKAVAAMPKDRINGIANDVIEQYATESNKRGADRAVFRAEITRGVAYKQLKLQAMDFLLRRLCLVDESGSTDSTLISKMMKDEDFSYFVTGALSD